nr:hypothetical protein [uncultured Oscillibacter sp.]
MGRSTELAPPQPVLRFLISSRHMLFNQRLKEALIKSTCADLRQKFLLARKKTAGILTDFKIF